MLITEVLKLAELKQYQAQFCQEHKFYPELEIGRYEIYSFKAKDDENAVSLALKFAAKRKEEDKNYVAYNLAGVREVRNVPINCEGINNKFENLDKSIEEAGFKKIRK